MKNTQYITIQGWMVNDLKLKGNDLIIYAIIYGFSQDGESKFNGSIEYIRNAINSSRGTVIKCLKVLTEKELIIKEKVSKGKIHFCLYQANLIKVQNLYNQSIKTELPSGTKTEPNNTTINTIEYRKKKFIDSVKPYELKYGVNMLNAFYSYWTELNKKKTKMRFEQQTFFEVGKRLATWNKNNKKGGDEGGGTFDASQYTN